MPRVKVPAARSRAADGRFIDEGSAAERFAAHCAPPDENGCVLWLAYKEKGYGRFQLAHGKPVVAHRWAWEKVHGPIPEGMEIHHVCRKDCVRVEHLQLLSRSEHRRHHCPPRGAEPRPCACGCSAMVTGWNYGSQQPKRFVNGHQSRTPEHRAQARELGRRYGGVTLRRAA